jgi:Skp family chaperone for outer membrane proteins
MSAEQIRNNSQVQAFNTRRQQLAARERGLQGDFECTRLITGEALLSQINPVVQAAARQRGAGVVINSSGAIYVAPEVDITATVILSPATRFPSARRARRLRGSNDRQ